MSNISNRLRNSASGTGKLYLHVRDLEFSGSSSVKAVLSVCIVVVLGAGGLVAAKASAAPGASGWDGQLRPQIPELLPPAPTSHAQLAPVAPVPKDHPSGLTTIFNPGPETVVEDDFVQINGTIDDSVKGSLWVVLYPERAPARGWPQSDDAANGSPVTREGGHFQVAAFSAGPHRPTSQSYTRATRKPVSLFPPTSSGRRDRASTKASCERICQRGFESSHGLRFGAYGSTPSEISSYSVR